MMHGLLCRLGRHRWVWRPYLARYACVWCGAVERTL